AIDAWPSFFKHADWDELYSQEEQEGRHSWRVANWTEQYIAHRDPVYFQWKLKFDSGIDAAGFSLNPLYTFSKRPSIVAYDKKTQFCIDSINVPEPYDIYWKVRNVGPEAYRRNQIRGQINKTNRDTHTENSNFKGRHFVECYIVKDDLCVAKDRINVPI